MSAASSNGSGPPAAVSARAYMRRALPTIYQVDDFGMGFVEGLETLLDPVVAQLDAMHHHFDPDLAPPRILALIGGWLGVELDETWPIERSRRLVRLASELSRRRGTLRGLEMSLRLAFPHLPLRVEDLGGVVSADDPADLPPAGPPQFVVYCEIPLDESEAARLDRTIKDMKPVHVNSRLRLPRAKRPEA